MKICSHCEKEFEDSFFLKGRRVCRTCRSIRQKEYNEKLKEKLEKDGIKECSICKKEKENKDFAIKLTYCKDCMNEKRRKNYESNKINPEYKEIQCPEGYKICKTCYVVKEENDFRPKRNQCKKCCNKERVAYSKGEIEKKPQIEKDEEDEYLKKLKASARKRVRETLPKEDFDKISDEKRFTYIYELLGCQMSFLREWFNYCFTDEMYEDNYGSFWSMDHVIPIKYFNTIEKIKSENNLCYGWYNVCPMRLKDNFTKSTNIDKTQLQTHLDKLTSFCYQNEIEINTEYLQLCAKHLDAGNP